MALRLLQATGGACTYALGAGVLGDITEPHERGSFFAWYQLGESLLLSKNVR
jgi:MFS family permease